MNTAPKIPYIGADAGYFNNFKQLYRISME